MNELLCWLCWRVIRAAECVAKVAATVGGWARARVKRLDLRIVNAGRSCR